MLSMLKVNCSLALQGSLLRGALTRVQLGREMETVVQGVDKRETDEQHRFKLQLNRRLAQNLH